MEKKQTIPGCGCMAQKEKVPFYGSAEQDAEFLQFIESEKHKKGALMPVLQKAQAIYGCLPETVQIRIAKELRLPLAKVYGVATFYSQFSLKKKGRYHIAVCLGTACYVKGAGEIYAALQEKLGIREGEVTPDGRFSLAACRCLGACGLAPVMMVNGEVHGRLRVDCLDEILEQYAKRDQGREEKQDDTIGTGQD